MGTTCAGEPPPASATGATADLECGTGADGAGDAPQLSALGAKDKPAVLLCRQGRGLSVSMVGRIVGRSRAVGSGSLIPNKQLSARRRVQIEEPLTRSLTLRYKTANAKGGGGS